LLHLQLPLELKDPRDLRENHGKQLILIPTILPLWIEPMLLKLQDQPQLKNKLRLTLGEPMALKPHGDSIQEHKKNHSSQENHGKQHTLIPNILPPWIEPMLLKPQEYLQLMLKRKLTHGEPMALKPHGDSIQEHKKNHNSQESLGKQHTLMPNILPPWIEPMLSRQQEQLQLMLKRKLTHGELMALKLHGDSIQEHKKNHNSQENHGKQHTLILNILPPWIEPMPLRPIEQLQLMLNRRLTHGERMALKPHGDSIQEHKQNPNSQDNHPTKFGPILDTIPS